MHSCMVTVYTVLLISYRFYSILLYVYYMVYSILLLHLLRSSSQRMYNNIICCLILNIYTHKHAFCITSSSYQDTQCITF